LAVDFGGSGGYTDRLVNAIRFDGEWQDMANLLVTGSIGIDSVDTPHGSRRDCIGGSAVYFALAASKLNPVRLVGTVGDDCPPRFFEVLKAHNIDAGGLEVRKGSRTFRWHGRYSEDMNSRETLEVHLNVLAEKGPTIPEAFRDSEYVFLANNDPALQLEFLDQVRNPRLVVFDTMDLWISQHRERLMKVFARTDGVVLNDSESRMLTGKSNILTAAIEISRMGPKYVVIKKGEHGVVLYTRDGLLVLPAFLTEHVVDPTGAGDSFAGGLMGYLASRDATVDDADAWRKGLVYATVVASFTVESFSVEGLTGLDNGSIEGRLRAFERIIQP